MTIVLFKIKSSEKDPCIKNFQGSALDGVSLVITKAVRTLTSQAQDMTPGCSLGQTRKLRTWLLRWSD